MLELGPLRRGFDLFSPTIGSRTRTDAEDIDILLEEDVFMERYAARALCCQWYCWNPIEHGVPDPEPRLRGPAPPRLHTNPNEGGVRIS